MAAARPPESCSDPEPEQERFYRPVGKIFDDLGIIGLPGLAHHLVEILELFIPGDPRAAVPSVGTRHHANSDNSCAPDICACVISSTSPELSRNSPVLSA